MAFKFFLFALLSLCLSVGAAYASLKQDDQPIEINIEEIYKTEIPYKLREVLNFYCSLDINKKADKRQIEKFSRMIIKSYKHNHTKQDAINEAFDYIKIFKEKFIVYKVEEYKKTRQYLILVLIGDNKEKFDFYIYKNNKNQYQIYNIYWEKMTDWLDLEYVFSKNYQKY
jgi:hypothetical protein